MFLLPIEEKILQAFAQTHTSLRLEKQAWGRYGPPRAGAYYPHGGYFYAPQRPWQFPGSWDHVIGIVEGRGGWGVPPRRRGGGTVIDRRPAPPPPDAKPYEPPQQQPETPEGGKTEGQPVEGGQKPPEGSAVQTPPESRGQPPERQSPLPGRNVRHPLYRPKYKIDAQTLQQLSMMQMIRPLLESLLRVAELLSQRQNQGEQQNQQQPQQSGVFQHKPGEGAATQQPPQQAQTGQQPNPEQPVETAPTETKTAFWRKETKPQTFERLMYNVSSVPGMVGFSTGLVAGPLIYFTYPKLFDKDVRVGLYDYAYAALMGGLSGASFDIALRLFQHALFR